MNEAILFAISVFLGFCAWGYFCFRYWWPKIKHLPIQLASRAILVLHLFRYVGASFLLSGVAGAALPKEFALPGAYGDLFAVALAWLALLLADSSAAVPALWAFNVWGTLDLLYAFYQGIFGPDFHPSALGATFYIPTVYVPLLLVTHGLLFALLLRSRGAAEASPLEETPGASRPRA